MNLEEMNWLSVQTYLKKNKTIIIPLGSIEQHGPSLPLKTDAFIADKISEHLGNKFNIAVGPLLNFGVSLVPHMKFAGTISFRPATHALAIEEYASSLYTHGFRKFFFVNGHGGNYHSLKNAMTLLLSQKEDISYAIFEWWKCSEVKEKEKELYAHNGVHATAPEVALVYAFDKTLVKMDKLSSDFHFNPKISINKASVTKNGIMNSNQTAFIPQHAEVFRNLVFSVAEKELQEFLNFH